MKKMLLSLLVSLFLLNSNVKAEEENLGIQLTDSEIVTLFFMFLEQHGIPVYINGEMCNDKNFQAFWLSNNDALIICNDNIMEYENPDQIFTSAIFHEMVHVAQDCLGGLRTEKMEHILLPEDIQNLVDSLEIDILNQLKAIYLPEKIPFELEAYYLEKYPSLILEILYAQCLPK